MINQKQKVRKIVWLLGALAFLFPLSAHAEETELNVYANPILPESQVDEGKGYYDLNLAPNEQETIQVEIGNNSAEPIRVQVTAHTAFTNVLGKVEYGKEAAEPDPTLIHSLADLIEPSGMIELSGNESKVIDLPLHMPVEAFEGFLAGGLRIAEYKEDDEESEEPEGEGVAIKNEFAYVIGMVVSNTRDAVQPELELLDVFADQLNYRNVISATLQNFTPTFVNRLAVEATVKRAGENDVLYEASQEMMQMAPNSNFNFPISLEGERFRSGTYILELTATSGEHEWSWIREFTIEADEARKLNREDVLVDTSINWWMILTIGLIVLVIALFVYMIWQKNKHQTSE
ncbi:DUF916 and DUF3324 domain-containing protein [Enterococcus sp. DIV1298c]|uniref:DUF916 and DUF3324 domain-containing protein n=1 Tax=Enterococcus sp. DIV1298c TaxID=2815328 RepID=UPI001A92ABBF|nr:DUF916 and DUF3324 domain-containing protein [Enterococcus sp. DIV1298c]MBO0460966.1 DUF916 and DUF3324 domain-containing protein [Enterococcus sp. DIV1298c]